MNAKELAQELLHIAEKLDSGGDVDEAIREIRELAEEIQPGCNEDLMAYTEA